MKKRLYKSNDKLICGVLGGIADYFDIDPTLVRILYAALSVFTAGFPGLTLYIICAFVIPVRPDNFNSDNGQNNGNNYNQNP